MGTLFLVATPIGNLDDITARALQTLRQVHLIAAEDTRRTRRLLAHNDIHTPQTSYHEHNKQAKIPRLLEALSQGDLALVSDAGTPGLNDPGYELVRAALDAGHTISPIPGASAPIAALVASGLPTDAFLYLGYLPHRSAERRRLLSEVANQPYTLIFLETPHRLLAALDDLLSILGDRPVAIARELTKIHEEILRSSLSAAREHFATTAPRGEITLVVAGAQPHAEVWPEARLKAALLEALSEANPASQVARRLAAESGWPRRKVYDMITELKPGTKTSREG